jgi:hypothetical protein
MADRRLPTADRDQRAPPVLQIAIDDRASETKRNLAKRGEKEANKTPARRLHCSSP